MKYIKYIIAVIVILLLGVLLRMILNPNPIIQPAPEEENIQAEDSQTIYEQEIQNACITNPNLDGCGKG